MNWDTIRLGEVTRTGEAFMERTSGHILFYSGLQEEKEHGVGFLLQIEIARNVKEFFSISERVAAVVIKLKKRYRLKMGRAYAPTTSYDDEAVNGFYEDIESAMKKG